MVQVKYIGKNPRMVAGKFMYTGDVRELNPKLAKELEGDANFKIAWKSENQEVFSPEQINEIVSSQPVDDTTVPEWVDEPIQDEPVDEPITDEEFVKPIKAKRGKRKS